MEIRERAVQTQALEAATCGRALPHVYGGLLSPKVPVGAAPFTRRA